MTPRCTPIRTTLAAVLGIGCATIVALGAQGIPKPAETAQPVERAASALSATKDPRLTIAGTWVMNEQFSTRAAEVPVGPNAVRGDPRAMVGDRGYHGRNQEPAGTRIALRELTNPSPQLIVTSDGTNVAITVDSGKPEEYVADDKPGTAMLDGAKTNVRTAWQKNILVQEFKLGSSKVTRMLQTSDEGIQLIVTVRVEAGDRDSGSAGSIAPLQFVYDRK